VTIEENTICNKFYDVIWQTEVDDEEMFVKIVDNKVKISYYCYYTLKSIRQLLKKKFRLDFLRVWFYGDQFL
jgi:hypothetical protein